MDWAVALAPGADLAGFRRAARGLAAAEAAPETVDWSGSALFGQTPADGPPLILPRRAGALIQSCVRHADPERFALLYQLVWRIHRGERARAEIASDPLVHRLEQMDKAVRREIHKMHAFVRFRRIEGEGDERFVAWFELEHFVVAERPGASLDAVPEPLASFVAPRWAHAAADLVTAPAGRVWRLRQPLQAESGTQVRHAIAADIGIGGLVPAAVAEYIRRHELYGAEPGDGAPGPAPL